ncbi:MAG: rhodanese-like domain-containing protein [Chloroflexi bacterium]|nr:rhodanese-like domain-containing protein [Chloroflexota bacterium]
MKKTLLLILLLLFTISACNAAASQTEPTIQAYPNEPYPNPTPTQRLTNLPLTEAGVPRVSAEEAKAAFDSGQAIIVDVRNVESFAENRIAGAISIPLANIENNPADSSLDKDQWIITYCT